MKRKILLVEDNEDFAAVLKKNFETNGWQVIHLGDGTDAVQTAKREKPDAILLDVFLPETDGFTTLKSLKAKIDPATKAPSDICHIPTVVMTGKAPMMEEMARFEGACEFMTKPIDVPALIQRIEQVISKRS